MVRMDHIESMRQRRIEPTNQRSGRSLKKEGQAKWVDGDDDVS